MYSRRFGDQVAGCGFALCKMMNVKKQVRSGLASCREERVRWKTEQCSLLAVALLESPDAVCCFNEREMLLIFCCVPLLLGILFHHIRGPPSPHRSSKTIHLYSLEGVLSEPSRSLSSRPCLGKKSSSRCYEDPAPTSNIITSRPVRLRQANTPARSPYPLSTQQ